MAKKIEPSPLTLQRIINKSVQKYAGLPAVSFVDGTPMSYSKLGLKINETASLLSSLGLRKGDKVALLGHNMPNWVIAYFSVVSQGMVIVPILPDFSESEIRNVIEHSESKVLFVSDRLTSRIENMEIPGLKARIMLNDLSLASGEQHIVPETVSSDVVEEVKEDDLAAIIYTSGTTGRSKGVMLSHKNIAFVAMQSYTFQSISSADVFLSLLPLSHTYENSIGLIYPIIYGASIYYLEKPPTASALLPALAKIRPTMMLSVPLIMEKLFQNQILKKFSENKFKETIYNTPVFRKLIHHIAGKKLYQTFGGRLVFFGIGGAKLDGTVERFLREANFPYAIGYGLTESAPLLAGAGTKQTKLGSTGFAVQGVDLKISKPDKKGMGEIWAKGPNVMPGYFKNPEATKEVLTQDGWFRTGDYGYLDAHKRLYIKGRMKNTIVSANGENIYPEDIESVINNNQYVLESLVTEEDGFLVAKILLDLNELEKNIEHIKAVIEDKKSKGLHTIQEFDDKYKVWSQQILKKEINNKLSRNSQIKRLELIDKPLEKTATQKIKRFLYTKQTTIKDDKDIL
ncbi:MAG: AMP-dependent synthetase and ligase [Bacteroidetes bacterium]|nr:AMP-dependent synthetase and ligase [Bacteroidota bacterium]